jgi:hypothetical protein
MKKDTIVQFVCFETTVDTDEFKLQWEQYSKLVSNDQEVTLQQEVERKSVSRYVSQHRCFANDFQFIFKKGRRSAHSPEVEMKVKEAGGYTAVQVECSHETNENEKKIFVFISTADIDLQVYRKISSYQYLNIYQAYYESCAFTYILEYFVENIQATHLMEQLMVHNRSAEIGMYKECTVQAKQKAAKATVRKKILL